MTKWTGHIAGLLICVILALAGESIGAMLDLPLPGGVIGFFILIMLFALRPSLQRHVEGGAELLLDNLLLLFIPAVMSIIAHPEFFGLLGLKLLFVLVIGTALMMASVGLFAQWMLRRSRTRGQDAQ